MCVVLIDLFINSTCIVLYNKSRPMSLIKFVSDLRQVGVFLRVLIISSTNKTDRHDIVESRVKHHDPVICRIIYTSMNRQICILK